MSGVGFSSGAFGSPTGIAGARVLGTDFHFHEAAALDWADGTFSTVNTSSPHSSDPGAPTSVARGASAHAPTRIDGRGLWVVPGFVDAHVHLAWTDFSESDRAGRSPQERDSLIEQNLAVTVAAGFTGARDAGGLGKSWIDRTNSGALVGPQVSGSRELLTRGFVDAVGGVGPAVEGVLDRGAQWVKLVATEGVTSLEGVPLESHFSLEEFRLAVGMATDAGARVMVHAWGGDAISWAIDAGVHSIEHGIFLTRDQARAAAARAITFVPTLSIYRLVLAMTEEGRLPASLRPRVAHAVDVHRDAVRIARDAGLDIAVGTDFGTVDQHGTNLVEVRALLDAGLSPTEVLRAATAVGSALLGAPGSDPPRGTIEPGAPADIVVFDRDPLEAAAVADPSAIFSVIRAGQLVRTGPDPASSPDAHSIPTTPREHHPS